MDTTDSSEGTEALTALTDTEVRLLTDLRRINEATIRLEHTLAEAHQAMLRACAAGRELAEAEQALSSASSAEQGTAADAARAAESENVADGWRNRVG